MKIIRRPTVTKAVIATVAFTILWAVTASSLPSCYGTGIFSPGRCVVHESDLHVICGWLAVASLITAVVLLIIRLRPGEPERRPSP